MADVKPPADPAPAGAPPGRDEARHRPTGPWRAFARRYLHDYNAAATRRWLALVGVGALAGGAALAWLALGRGIDLRLMGAALLFIAVLAAFPVHIPRTKYHYPAADIFVFTVLAWLGPAAAVIAAGVEGAVASRRQSKRLTSWLSTPAAAMAGMALAAAVYEGLHRVLAATPMGASAALLAALTAAALPYFAATTLPLIAIVAAKGGQRVSLREWLGNYGWLAAVYLMSATAAAVLAMNARGGGAAVFVAAGVVALVVLALVHLSLAHHEREHAAQDARIRDAELEAAANQRRFLAAFTHAAIGMAIVRPDGRVHQVNAALRGLLGRDDPALLGQAFETLLHPADVRTFREHGRALHAPGGSASSIELRCLHADGSELWVSLHCSRFDDPAAAAPDGNAAGAASGMIYQLHDISSRRRAEGRLQHIAYHDGLTDLANRNRFVERLQAMVEASRDDGCTLFAVLFLDLDRFKVVNDSLGHAAGNELLREVARRLAACVRPHDLVARLGGDEFAILLDALNDTDHGRALALRVQAALAEPVVVNGTELLPAASIGVTFSDLGYRTADEILRDADLAMYEAKTSGRGVALFDNSMLERVAQKLALESDLRHAIGDGQLRLQYQPIYTLEPYRLTGFEALVRWVHPTRGPVSPVVFVALAEETGIIGALTHWVIGEAVGQLAHWHRTLPGSGHLTVNVNVSGRDLAGDALLPHVCTTLAQHGLAPGRLTLEITETTLMAHMQEALRTLQALREAGVRISIDDFGTGYSSLAYLSTLPIDTLKIDRSFVMGLHERPQNVEIVRAVVTLGQALGRKIVAEGIETAEQLQALRALGVSHGQGFLLSRPLAAEKVHELLVVETA